MVVFRIIGWGRFNTSPKPPHHVHPLVEKIEFVIQLTHCTVGIVINHSYIRLVYSSFVELPSKLASSTLRAPTLSGMNVPENFVTLKRLIIGSKSQGFIQMSSGL